MSKESTVPYERFITIPVYSNCCSVSDLQLCLLPETKKNVDCKNAQNTFSVKLDI